MSGGYLLRRGLVDREDTLCSLDDSASDVVYSRLHEQQTTLGTYAHPQTHFDVATCECPHISVSWIVFLARAEQHPFWPQKDRVYALACGVWGFKGSVHLCTMLSVYFYKDIVSLCDLQPLLRPTPVHPSTSDVTTTTPLTSCPLFYASRQEMDGTRM